jgi:hypothetical protein
MLQQRLDTYELLMTLPPVPVIPIHKFHADTLNSRQHSELLAGRPAAINWLRGPLADWIAALDFHRSQFQSGFTWFDMVLCCSVD